jgi:hypothetical protein
MSVPRTIRLLAAAVALLAVSGCSKSALESASAPSAAAREPVFEAAPPLVDTTVTMTAPLTASQDIDGAVGGKVAVGPYRIEVPPGAFKGVATITIVQPDPTVLKCDLTISPASANQFAVPVVLAVKLPNSLALTLDQNMWLDPGADLWRLIPSTPDLLSTELRSPLWHFSTYGTGRAGW